MAIKSAVVLACTGGIDYTQFRLLTDVDRFAANLEQGITATLATLRKEIRWLNSEMASFTAVYSHPPAKTNSHLTTLHELFHKVAQLESVCAMLVSGFGHMPKSQQLIAKAQQLLAHVRNKVDKALAQLSLAVDKHQPAFYQRICAGLVRRIQKQAGVTAVTPMSMARVLVEPGTQKVVGTQFATYLCVHGLTDASGYVHERYHVVITCMVDVYGRYTLNYSLQPQLLLPGRFKGSNTFDSPRQGWEMICNSMREEGFAWEAT